eukprot:359920-Chlamydomonas_euryale.AAC.10
MKHNVRRRATVIEALFRRAMRSGRSDNMPVTGKPISVCMVDSCMSMKHRNTANMSRCGDTTNTSSTWRAECAVSLQALQAGAFQTSKAPASPVTEEPLAWCPSNCSFKLHQLAANLNLPLHQSMHACMHG